MNGDPEFAKPRPNGARTENGSTASTGSQGASRDPGSGSSSPASGRPQRIRRTRTGPTLGQAVSSGWRHAQELADYVRTLIDVRTDRAALDLRRKATRIGLALIASLAGGTLVIAGSLRVVVGLADGLTALFGGRAWLGDLTAGVLLLGGLAALGAAYVSRSEKKELEEHIEKYERKHREHRARHGRHVSDPKP